MMATYFSAIVYQAFGLPRSCQHSDCLSRLSIRLVASRRRRISAHLRGHCAEDRADCHEELRDRASGRLLASDLPIAHDARNGCHERRWATRFMKCRRASRANSCRARRVAVEHGAVPTRRFLPVDSKPSLSFRLRRYGLLTAFSFDERRYCAICCPSEDMIAA